MRTWYISRAKRVFILEHYLAPKSFAAVRKAFSNAYPDKEVPNKTTVHRRSAREYIMFASAQLLRNSREQRPSNKGDLDSSGTGMLLLLISFCTVLDALDCFGVAFYMVHTPCIFKLQTIWIKEPKTFEETFG
jgi:hypothetical protein